MNRNPDDTPGYVSLKIIDEIPPFQSPIEFEFDPEVNVFIGPNATGKSTILKLLCQGFPHNIDSDRFAVEWTGGRIPPQIYLPPVRDVAPGDPSEYGRIGQEDVSDDFLKGLIYGAVLEIVFDTRDDRLSDDPEGWDFDRVMPIVQESIDWALRGLGPIDIIDEDKFLKELLGYRDRYGNEAAVLRDGALSALLKDEFVREARSQLEKVDGGRFLLNGVDPYTSFPAVRVKLALDRLRRVAPDRWAQVMNVAVSVVTTFVPRCSRERWTFIERRNAATVAWSPKPRTPVRVLSFEGLRATRPFTLASLVPELKACGGGFAGWP